MQKIITKYGEYTVEEYIAKEVSANKGTDSVIYKEDLVKMCAEKNIVVPRTATKLQLYNLLIESGVTTYEFAVKAGVGVGSAVYQKAFGITHADVKRLERIGILKVVGQRRYRDYGQYLYAPLYDIMQYAEFTSEAVKELLEKYPKGYRCKARKI